MPRRKAKYGGRAIPKQQLCWTCAKATNGELCPWVKDYTPVPNWTAEPVTHYLYTDPKSKKEFYEDTYSISKCPLYLNDTKAKNGKPLILISGPCASGKDYLAEKLAMKYHLNILKSKTTRPPRAKDENTHTFVTPIEYAQDKALKQIVAETHINGYVYYSTKRQLENADIYIVDPKGISDILNIKHLKRAVYCVLISASEPTRWKRLSMRFKKEVQYSNKDYTVLATKYRNRYVEDLKAYATADKIDWDIIIDNNTDDSRAYKALKKYMYKIRLIHHLPFIK